MLIVLKKDEYTNRCPFPVKLKNNTETECLEYRVLPIQFHIFTLAGVWCPDDWRAATKILYKCYTIVQATAGVLFWLTMLINILLTRGNSENVYENMFAISTLSYAAYKEIFILRNRKKIVRLIEKGFEDKWYKAKNMFEAEVMEQYKQQARLVTEVYAIGIISGLATKAIAPILKSRSSWSLPIEAWYPYETNNLTNYCLSYIHQLLGGIPLISLHISVDSLFVGLVLQMCIQLRLLRNRMRSIINSSNLHRQHTKLKNVDNDLSNYAHKHASILQFGKDLNLQFLGIMTGQVMVTIPNICLNVYLLSQHRGGITLHFIDSFFCFATCIMQIFLYCWYGNQIIVHSLDVATAAYQINWPLLNISSRKKILTIMMRATRSIQFSSGTFIMNLNSFIEILKTSYSAYRVLQTTS